MAQLVRDTAGVSLSLSGGQGLVWEAGGEEGAGPPQQHVGPAGRMEAESWAVIIRLQGI